MTHFMSYGPYPDDWNEAAKTFFDSEPQSDKEFNDWSDEEWDRVQELFDKGWLETGMSREEHERYRDQYYEMLEISAAQFDWDAARDYWDEVSPAT